MGSFNLKPSIFDRPKEPPRPPGGALKISAAYGRLYVAGPGYRVARNLPGAAEDEKKGRIELSLTLETLRELRKKTGKTPQEFAAFCEPSVLGWAKAAGAAESRLAELHARLESGWRMDFPWADTRANTRAPDNAPDDQTYLNYLSDPGHVGEIEGRYWTYRNPFAHQQVMATVACNIDGVAFLCEQGTAKTRAAIESIQWMRRNGRIDIAIVVCPKGVMRTWRKEVPLWAPGLEAAVLIDMPVAQRREQIQQWANGGRMPDIVVLNYDVLHLLEDAILDLMAKRRVAFVPDEGHKLRNPQTKTSKAGMKLAQYAKWRMLLTGTPILQGAHDIWAQWYVVDLGITFGANFVQFKREWFEENPYEMTLDPKSDGTLTEIGMRLRRRGLRYRKEDCLDLPPKLYEVAEVEMTPEQRKAYRQMEEDLIARLTEMAEGRDTSHWFSPEPSEIEDAEGIETGRVATAANQLAMILRLTQITSGFVNTSEGEIHRFQPNPKLDGLVEMVNEQVAAGHQILVWARYREDNRAIRERLQREGVPHGFIYGGVTTRDRERYEDGFNSGELRVLVVNAASVGMGANYQAASIAHYYSQGYSLEQRLQSEDRCHRAGSERHRSITYVDWQMKGTIDEVIVAALADKKDVAEVVVDLKRMLAGGHG